jgi:ATP-binding cassette subfamily B multidrug efflux pump
VSAPASARDALFEEEVLGKAYDARLARRLWQYVAPYRAQVLFTVLMLFPLIFFELAPAWIIKTGIDREIVPRVTGAPPAPLHWPTAPAWLPEAVGSFAHDVLARAAGWLEAPAGVSPLVWLAALYFAVTVLSGVVAFVDPLVMSRTGQAAMRDLRREVFAHIQRLHLGFFDTMPVGRLVRRATN